MAINLSLLERALHSLGTVLRQRGDEYEIVASGGSGLLLLGVTVRATRDLDFGSKHADDLRLLAPTEEELLFAARWTLTQDASPAFRRLLRHTLAALGVVDLDGRL